MTVEPSEHKTHPPSTRERQPAPRARGRALRRTGFGLMAAQAVLVGLFVIGETLTDPGGWTAVGLIAAWAVPLAGLCVLARRWPGWAVRVLPVLTGLLLCGLVWIAIAPVAWRQFENQHGPVRALAVFVLTTAIAVLGLTRTAPAGLLLLVVGAAPIVLAGSSAGGLGSLAAVGMVPLLTGGLYLASAALARSRLDEAP